MSLDKIMTVIANLFTHKPSSEFDKDKRFLLRQAKNVKTEDDLNMASDAYTVFAMKYKNHIDKDAVLFEVGGELYRKEFLVANAIESRKVQ